MLAGKDFDRTMHGFKLVDEALSTRFYKSFVKWCVKKDITFPTTFATLLSDLEMAYHTKQDQLVQLLVSKLGDMIEKFIEPQLDQFRNEGQEFPTFKLWDDFLQRVMHPMKLCGFNT